MAQAAAATTVSAKLDATDIIAITDWISKLMGSRLVGKMEKPDILKGVEIKPQKATPFTGKGTFRLSHGSYYVVKPLHGKGLTTDPNPGGDDADFYIKHVGDDWCSIYCCGNSKYCYAGDQATVKACKDKAKEHEKFRVYVMQVLGSTFCSIKCKRDGEYWYVDKHGIVRHRNRNEKDGFCVEVFQLTRQ